MQLPEFYMRGEEVYFRCGLRDDCVADHKARDEDKKEYPVEWRAFEASLVAPAPAEAVTELVEVAEEVLPSEDAPKKSKKKGLFGRSE